MAVRKTENAWVLNEVHPHTYSVKFLSAHQREDEGMEALMEAKEDKPNKIYTLTSSVLWTVTP